MFLIQKPNDYCTLNFAITKIIKICKLTFLSIKLF